MNKKEQSLQKAETLQSPPKVSQKKKKVSPKIKLQLSDREVQRPLKEEIY